MLVESDLNLQENALEYDQLTKLYGNNLAVDNISFCVKAGEIFALLGPNGAGKSTTLNMTIGLVRKTSGSIKIFGNDIDDDQSLCRRVIGLMHQEIVFDNFFTLEKSLEMHCGYYGTKVDHEWLQYLLHRLGLFEHRKKKPMMLSGGMKRRLMLAKALMHKPPLLILDEPTAGVDVELRHSLWEFVLDLNKKEKMTILLTTHYLEEAERLCNRIAIIDRGKLLVLDTKDNLLQSQQSKSLEDVFLKLTKKNNGAS